VRDRIISSVVLIYVYIILLKEYQHFWLKSYRFFKVDDLCSSGRYVILDNGCTRQLISRSIFNDIHVVVVLSLFHTEALLPGPSLRYFEQSFTVPDPNNSHPVFIEVINDTEEERFFYH